MGRPSTTGANAGQNNKEPTVKTMAQELQDLLNTLHEAEDAAAILKKFDEEGGKYRLTITVDHPDWKVKDTVEKVARAFVPRTTLVKGLVDAADKDVKRAKDAILTAAMSHGISNNAHEHVAPGMVIQTREAP